MSKGELVATILRDLSGACIDDAHPEDRQFLLDSVVAIRTPSSPVTPPPHSRLRRILKSGRRAMHHNECNCCCGGNTEEMETPGAPVKKHRPLADDDDKESPCDSECHHKQRMVVPHRLLRLQMIGEEGQQ